MSSPKSWRLYTVGGTEEYLGEVASYQECVDMVRNQRPDANGVTVTTGGVGSCYAEFGMTGNNDSGSWESAFLADAASSGSG